MDSRLFQKDYKAGSKAAKPSCISYRHKIVFHHLMQAPLYLSFEASIIYPTLLSILYAVCVVSLLDDRSIRSSQNPFFYYNVSVTLIGKHQVKTT
jgi:hypothetical protein